MSAKAPIELVIFDCDGVLVDSEHITMRTIVESCALLGLELDVEQASRLFEGGHWALVLAEVERRLGRPVPDDFTTTFRARLVAALDNEIEPVDGIFDVLAQLPHPKCVASNGPHRKMHTTLGRTGLLPHFEGRIFSAYDIDDFKPAPGLFLHAARTLGAHPDHCVVIEDSENGVRAARAAGMRSIAYVPRGDGEVLASHGATLLRDMRELLSLL